MYYNTQEFEEKWSLINKRINNELGCSRELFTFKDERDKFALRMIIPKQMNKQVSLLKDHNLKFKGDIVSKFKSEYFTLVVS